MKTRTDGSAGSPARQGLRLGLARGVGQLILVAILAGLARLVGVERLGVVATAMGLAATMSGLIDFGAGSYWVREFSARRMTADEFAARAAGKIVVGGGVAALLLVSLVGGLSVPLVGGIAVVLVSSILSQTYQVVLVAAGANAALARLALLERVAMGVTVVLFWVFLPLEPEASFFLAYLTGSMAFAIGACREAPNLRPKFRDAAVCRAWSGSRFYGLSTALISLQASDVAIGGWVGGSVVSGTYGAVNRWTTPITLATGAFTTLLAPVIAGAKGREDVWAKLRGSLWAPGLSVGLALVIAVGADPVIRVLLGTDFLGSVPVLRLLAVAAALSSCSQVMTTVLQSRRRERSTALVLGVAVPIQLILVAPLVSLYGAVGLASAAVVGQTLVCLMLALHGVIIFKNGRV